MSRILYDRKRGGTRVVLWVERNDDGAFVIAGQDLGTGPSSIFGDSDYEYWYTFDADQEQDLVAVLGDRLAAEGVVGVDQAADTDEFVAAAFKAGIFGRPPAVSRFPEDAGIEHTFAGYA